MVSHHGVKCISYIIMFRPVANITLGKKITYIIINNIQRDKNVFLRKKKKKKKFTYVYFQ